jgi:hypothetical protein
MRYWGLIADNLNERGWSLGWVSAVDSERRMIWIADAHRNNAKCFIVRADEIQTAFAEPEAEISHVQASAEPVAASGEAVQKPLLN